MGMGIYYKYDINNYIEYNSNDFNILNYDNIVYLNCIGYGLKKLPILPINLIKLYCYHNKLINLPILPNSLIELECDNNKLINLPILSINLIQLHCSYNKLINLPILPINLMQLNCSYNKLNYLPKINKHMNFIEYDNIIKYFDIYNLNIIHKIYYYIKF